MTIREIRIEKGMTQEDVAKKLFVSPVTVHQWESGKCFPRLTKLPKIALALGISVGEAMDAFRETVEKHGQR